MSTEGPGDGGYGTPDPPGDTPAGRMVYVSKDDEAPLPVEYVERMTVKDAVLAAGVLFGRHQTATVNGLVVGRRDHVTPGCTIVVTDNVAGG